MAISYAAWPVKADVQSQLSTVGITPGASWTDDNYQAIINAVIKEIGHRTKRQFLPSGLGIIRYFDGSGTGLMEIDEFITLQTVKVVGFFGSVPGLSLTNVVSVADNGYPQTRIQIYRSSLPALTTVWLDRFPDGRQNIEVTANWGYAATIPEDLWQAAREEMAARVASQVLFDTKGRLQEWREDEVWEKYALSLPGEAAGWHENFQNITYTYKKPSARYIRKLTPRMI